MASSSSLTRNVRSPSHFSDEENSVEPQAKRQKLNLKKCKPCRDARKKCVDVRKVNPRFPVSDVLVDGTPVLVDGQPLKVCDRCYTRKQREPNNAEFNCGERVENNRTRGPNKPKAQGTAAGGVPTLSAAASQDANLLSFAAGNSAHTIGLRVDAESAFAAAPEGERAMVPNTPDSDGLQALIAAADATPGATSLSPGGLLKATQRLQVLSVERKQTQSEIDALTAKMGILNAKIMVATAKVGLVSPEQISALGTEIGGLGLEIVGLNQRLEPQKAHFTDIETEERKLLTLVQTGVQNLSHHAA